LEKEEKIMKWVLKAMSNKYVPKKATAKYKISEEKQLSYCESCKQVWEKTWGRSYLFYRHLPTYGLPRKICKHCT
tara:strand:+ start:113 stop:337 length:225 start_codon:yes stop_codon:yes gene_type:complete